LKNAAEFSDRADAVIALGKIKNDEEVVAALASSLRNDKAWGVRATAADTIGQLGGASASKQLLDALNTTNEPWVRDRVVSALANFKDDVAVAAKLESIAREDSSYRARAAALQALARLKASSALATLNGAVASDSPDGFLRNAALRAMGSLGDDKAVPLLLEWSAPGKPIESRRAAIASLARLQKDNKEITKQIVSYLNEPHFPIRISSIFALGSRGDASAIPALEDLLKSGDLSIEMTPMIKEQIVRLKKPQGRKDNAEAEEDGEEGDKDGGEAGQSAVTQRLDKLERLIQEMNEKLKSIETRLPPPKQ
jgi:HEAT repeat protein